MKFYKIEFVSKNDPWEIQLFVFAPFVINKEEQEKKSHENQ